MIPLWMMPLSLVAGNTMLLKPSEQDPGATLMLVELAKVEQKFTFNLFFFCRKRVYQMDVLMLFTGHMML